MSDLYAPLSIFRKRPSFPIRRLLLLVVATTLALAAVGIASPAAHAAGLTCTVTPGKAPYPTISSATSGATGANCSTVILPAHKFTEQVVIDHALTLTGAGAAKTTILHPAPGPTTKSIVENGDAEDYVIDVTAPGVAISKLTIDGASYGCHTKNTCGSSNSSPYYALFGIALQARNFTLNAITIQHLGNAKQQGEGVPIGGQTIVSGGNGAATFKNSTFQTFTGLALMELDSEPAPFTFTGNKVVGSPTNIFGLPTAGDGAQITSNTFTGFHYAGKASNNPLKVAVALVLGGSNALVSGNHFSNDDVAVMVAGASGKNTIANNTFQYTRGAILLAQNGAGQIVRNNKISSTTAGANVLASGAGILLCQENDDQISGNTITTSVYGVAVFDSTQSQCGAESLPNNIWNNTITRSKKDDLYDQTQGGDTGGTMNTYSGDACRTSVPKSLCTTRAFAPVVSPDEGNSVNEFFGTTAISPDDIWAVGDFADSNQNNDNLQPLAEHWNGASWSTVPTPTPSVAENRLFAVSGTSASDVWAVGYYEDANTSTILPLVEHWNGSQWSVVACPGGGILHGVVALSPNNVWAVGYEGRGVGEMSQVIEHWNGTQWSIVSGPGFGSGAEEQLNAITALSPTDIWAVGSAHAAGPAPSNGYQWYPLVEHWNGTTWSTVAAPNPGPSGLSAISLTSDKNMWVVGYVHNTTLHYNRTLAMHWNGTQWTVTPTANPGAGDNALMGVKMLANGHAWAVGSAAGTSGGSVGLVEYWNGTAWQLQQLPSINSNDWTLDGVVVTSLPTGYDVWAVGSGNPASGPYAGKILTLVEHY